MRTFLSFVLGASIGAASLAAAAPGDLVYRRNDPVVAVTGAEAAALADAFIALDAWTGARADMRNCNVWREAAGEFRAQCSGVKTDTPANLATRAAAGERIEVVGAVE